ncbi:hypothetical protein CAQUA_10510 [Corynebacterium aquatimens]|nr:hypothetical protein CAQUA_10510 [Corynebacterium aquatimens]
MNTYQFPSSSHAPRPITLHDGVDITPFVPGQLTTTGGGPRASRTFFAIGVEPRPMEWAMRDAELHPRKHAYVLPAGLRAVAAALENPGCVVSGLSALAIYGLSFFSKGCDATLIGEVEKTQFPAMKSALVRRRKLKSTWTVRWQDRAITASRPLDALIEALQDLRDGVHAWEVPSWVADDLAFRAISLIDASSNHFGFTPTMIKEAAKGRLNSRWIRKILQLSSGKADSPKETEMRIISRAILEGPESFPLKLVRDDMRDPFAENIRWAAAQLEDLRLKLSEQVPIYEATWSDWPITIFDLALTALKIGLMYDGEHHLQRSQRDKDASISLKCTLQGWLVLRFSAGTLETLPGALVAAVRMRVNTLDPAA